MKETKVTCDACENDLTEAGQMPRYRLSLSCEELPSNSEMQYAVIVHLPIDRTHHFCNTGCLKEWAERG